MTLNNYIWMFLVFNPLKLRTSEQLSSYFMRRTMIKHNSCNKLLNKFQDDILCVLAIYPCIFEIYCIKSFILIMILSSAAANPSTILQDEMFKVFLMSTYICSLTIQKHTPVG